MDEKQRVEQIRASLRADPTYQNPRHNTNQPTFRPVTPASTGPSASERFKNKKNDSNKVRSTVPGPDGLLQWAITAYEWVDQMFKSLGVLVGGIATSLADWLLGAYTMSVLFSGSASMTPTESFGTGLVFSLALWGIQIIMWRLVFTGKVTKVAKGNNNTKIWLYAFVFLGILLMKFGDDFSDVIGVFWAIKDNPMQFALPSDVYVALRSTILFLVWCVCGFAEVFVAISLNLLKDDHKN